MFRISDFIGRMCKLNKRFSLEKDDFSQLLGKTVRKLLKLNCQLNFFIPIHHCTGNYYSNFINTGTFPTKKILSVKNQHKWIQLSTLICLSSNVMVFFENWKKPNCGWWKPIIESTIKFFTIGLWLCIKINVFFPPVNGSNVFEAVNYGAHIKTKLEYSFKDVFRAMTIHELNTLHHIW